MARDEAVAERAAMSAKSLNVRKRRAQQRLIDGINKELKDIGCTGLPPELLFRTHVRWLKTEIIDVPPAALEPIAQEPGLACFQPEPVYPERVAPCELIGIAILHRPASTFLSRHTARHEDELYRDIWNGVLSRSGTTGERFASLLAERISLRPLVLKSDWSEVAATINGDGHREYSINAHYEGDPSLWLMYPGVEHIDPPLRAILDDWTITLKARAPSTGEANPQADLATAAAKLEERLSRAAAVIETFNAARREAAVRRVRQEFRRRRRHG